MENPTLDYLLYLLKQCIDQCGIDPDKTTVSELLKIITRAETPVGW